MVAAFHERDVGDENTVFDAAAAGLLAQMEMAVTAATELHQAPLQAAVVAELVVEQMEQQVLLPGVEELVVVMPQEP